MIPMRGRQSHAHLYISLSQGSKGGAQVVTAKQTMRTFTSQMEPCDMMFTLQLLCLSARPPLRAFPCAAALQE